MQPPEHPTRHPQCSIQSTGACTDMVARDWHPVSENCSSHCSNRDAGDALVSPQHVDESRGIDSFAGRGRASGPLPGDERGTWPLHTSVAAPLPVAWVGPGGTTSAPGCNDDGEGEPAWSRLDDIEAACWRVAHMRDEDPVLAAEMNDFDEWRA